MNRRGFLGLLGLAAAAPVVAKIAAPDGVALNNVAHERYSDPNHLVQYDSVEHSLGNVLLVNNSSKPVTLVIHSSDSSVPMFKYVVGPGKTIMKWPGPDRYPRIKLRQCKDGQFFPTVYVRNAGRRRVFLTVSTRRGHRHEVYTYNYATRKRAMDYIPRDHFYPNKGYV